MNTTTTRLSNKAGMVGWDGVFPTGQRPAGIHPWALVGAPPEHREWLVGQKTFDPVIHDTALVDAFCTVDAGHENPTRIGARSWLQKRVHVGHDTVIGDDCEICVGVVLCGHVTVGNRVRIGGNTWVKPRVRIGDGAVIGGGAVVTKDVPAGEVWAGSPARFLRAVPLEQARAVTGYPSEAELDEWNREAAMSGLGYRVDGDHA